ncbi:NAD(+)--rifampin ADP-ribosyltransferase [Fusibacter ferrireducens]|uniref:NAD(+)--rifampin ADP-ribosyltransferase n=1 Tax=Fusibacter ferrireducens TaxID=2785058 RepID=A0ABR9ZQC7_9FIRM|nr:NAD(+)--rifampin ADP-ribosyltransferase [Fusibacter ferrireducens]MBF4692130.1 NAD(+)--rifampin ADP-ribosyltransferase [Fusibacter ferrireducens]
MLESALKPTTESPTDEGPFYHGTKAELSKGDLISAGHISNYGQSNKANYIYFTATLDAAIWGAELSEGEGQERIYVVEPLEHFENDPNLTDKKFPGNPTRSYRSRGPLKIVGEVSGWAGHSPEVIKQMRDQLDELKKLGIQAIES